MNSLVKRVQSQIRSRSPVYRCVINFTTIIVWLTVLDYVFPVSKITERDNIIFNVLASCACAILLDGVIFSTTRNNTQD